MTRLWWRRGAVGLMATAVVGAVLTPAVAEAERAPASDEVFLVQATPGASVDIKIDGHMVAKGVSTKQIVGPMKLAPGKHVVSFQSADWTVPASFSLSKSSTDIVLHWPASVSPKPTVTVFSNNLKPVGSGKGRVAIAHTAVVPPADVRVDKQVLFSNIANGEFVSAEVPAMTYSVDIVPTGTSSPLFGPVDLPVKADALTRVFAIGKPQNGSMDAIVQVLPLQGSSANPPTSVDTGSAGLVATPPSGGFDAAAGIALAGGLGVAILTVALWRRRVAR